MISIVIPNYNGYKHLSGCFNTIRKQTFRDYKIILVDNASTDESVIFIEKNYPQTHIIKLNYNSGFAKAVNIGIKESLSDNDIKYILLLNNDVECHPNFIEELLKGFKTMEIGSVACKMLNFYDRKIIDDTGDFVKLKNHPFTRGQGEEDSGQYDKPEFIFGACTGAALYRREVFEKIGLFDEDFFAYYEDVDISFRMQIYGFKCYYNPKSICFHKRGATTGKEPSFYIYLLEKNIVTLRIKNYPISILIKYNIYFIIARVWRLLKYIREGSYSYFISGLKGYLKGLIDTPKSIRKRMKIQKSRKVTNDYMKRILNYKLYLK